MVNIMTYYAYLNMVDFLPLPIIFFWEIMLIEETNPLKLFVFCLHIKLNIQKISLFLEETMSVHQLTVSMGFTLNVPFLILIFFVGKHRYSIKLWKTFTDCFNCLPVAAIIDEKIFCMHGGLSPGLTSMDEIRNIYRPTDCPETGLLCDLLWSDPEKSINGWGQNNRGVSFTFGTDVVKEFLETHDLDLICRAHQVVEDGYEFFAKRSLVTIFSAPNYCGEFDNAGAIMSVDENLTCSFQVVYFIFIF